MIQMCDRSVKLSSVTIKPRVSTYVPGYTTTETITIYQAGSPEQNSSMTENTGYCIDGYHENKQDKPWKYDSITGGLQEGKCS